MVKKGDTIILKRPMGMFKNVGESCIVDNVEGNVITFVFGNGQHYGCMSEDELDKYFTVRPNNSVSESYIQWLLSHSAINVETKCDKCTIVTVELPNGFVLVESSACVSPENYSEDDGYDYCIGKIRDKLWMLEGYLLQQKLYEQSRLTDRG